MLYDIRLTLEQHYPAGSDHVRALLRLAPPDLPGQRVLACRLTIDPPPDERQEGRDFFANRTTMVAWHRPLTAITCHLHARVRRLAPEAEMDVSPPLADLAAQAAGAGLGPASPLHFRMPSPRIGPLPEAVALARDALAALTPPIQTRRAPAKLAAPPPAISTRAAVAAIGRALHAEMTFDPTATDATTPPETAFAARRGVCQDYAQIMIGALRGLGIPAAYVSGFLRTTPPPGQPRLAGVDAMHAWVAAWCGTAQGWQAYDPTNAQWAAGDYVTVATGRDYAEAAPVRGAIRTAGAQRAHHTVDVIALPDDGA